MLPAVHGPAEPFEPRRYHYEETSQFEPDSDEFPEQCQCAWVLHGWEGCPNDFPEVPEFVGYAMVCEACETRHDGF